MDKSFSGLNMVTMLYSFMYCNTLNRRKSRTFLSIRAYEFHVLGITGIYLISARVTAFVSRLSQLWTGGKPIGSDSFAFEKSGCAGSNEASRDVEE